MGVPRRRSGDFEIAEDRRHPVTGAGTLQVSAI